MRKHASLRNFGKSVEKKETSITNRSKVAMTKHASLRNFFQKLDGVIAASSSHGDKKKPDNRKNDRPSPDHTDSTTSFSSVESSSSLQSLLPVQSNVVSPRKDEPATTKARTVAPRSDAQASIANATHSSPFTQGPKWMRRRYHQPASLIQSHVRGHLQRRRFEVLVNEVKRKQEHQRRMKASMTIQAATRAWIGRMQSRVAELELKLHRIQVSHKYQLDRIQVIKQQEMKRIYQETMERAAFDEDEMEEQKQLNLQRLVSLKRAHARLRQQNKNLKKQTLVVY